MSQLSFPSFESALLVRDAHGRYLSASADDILEAARQVIDQSASYPACRSPSTSRCFSYDGLRRRRRDSISESAALVLP